MNGKDLTALYYSELEKRHYRPMKAWGRDGKWAKKFLESGRTEEDFMKLLNKALVGPKKSRLPRVSDFTGSFTFCQRSNF